MGWVRAMRGYEFSIYNAISFRLGNSAYNVYSFEMPSSIKRHCVFSAYFCVYILFEKVSAAESDERTYLYINGYIYIYIRIKKTRAALEMFLISARVYLWESGVIRYFENLYLNLKPVFVYARVYLPRGTTCVYTL